MRLAQMLHSHNLFFKTSHVILCIAFYVKDLQLSHALDERVPLSLQESKLDLQINLIPAMDDMV